MRKAIAVSLIILLATISSPFTLLSVHSSFSATIFIRPDGSIKPSNAPLHHSGQTYTLTENVNAQIVLERGGTILDGAGYMLHGYGGGVGLNMTCSNATAENFQISNWQAGILGVFNNNTVRNCVISGCESGLKLYAQFYVVVENTIEKNSEGIRDGSGGIDFIAGNNITTNGVGLYLFDSGNVIAQNSISDCSVSAITLDEAGYNQTVYHNNFVNNGRSVNDFTYNNYLGRPPQSTVPAWDSGTSGNYWSNYNGTDLDGDGIGDIAYDISTYNLNNAPAPYAFIDRYPLMKPFNIEAPIPAVPSALNVLQVRQVVSTASDEAKAVSFLRDVLQLDLNKYKLTLNYENIQVPNSGYPTQDLDYRLSYGANSANANFEFGNNTLTNLTLYSSSFFGNSLNKLVFTYQYQNDYDTANRIMQNYQTWKNDPAAKQMLNLLSTAEPAKNITEKVGNIDLKIGAYPSYSTFDWKYTFNGAEYSGVSLRLEGGISNLVFSDNRPIYEIGNTIIDISERQAIQIAQNFVKTLYSYSVDFGNGTSVIVKNMNVNATDVSAGLATTTRNPTTLYPYWDVHVPLDHTYPGNTVGVTVQVWADTGTVFQAQREVGPLNLTPFNILPSITLLFEEIVILFIAATVVVVVVVVYAVQSTNKKDNARKTS